MFQKNEKLQAVIDKMCEFGLLQRRIKSTSTERKKEFARLWMRQKGNR